MADAPLSFRQGTIVSWTHTTGENTVNVGGTVMANLPVLTTSEVTGLEAGDVVGLLRSGTQYFILGRIDLASAGGGSLNIGASSAVRGLLTGGYDFSSIALPVGGVTVNVHTATGLSCTVNPEPNRLLKISFFGVVTSTVAADRVTPAIRDVTSRELPAGYTGPLFLAGSGASAVYVTSSNYIYLQERGADVSAGPRGTIASNVAYDDRGISGSRTYEVSIRRTSGTGTCRIDGDTVGPSVLVVEDIGPFVTNFT